jgi:hypothetical protein
VDAAFGVVVEQRGGHLAAAGVLHAHEQHLGHLLGDRALHLAERAQALAREAMAEQRHEVLDARVGERLQRLGHVALDRLGRERAGELLGQAIERALQMTHGDEVDIEIPQSGCHRCAPPLDALRSPEFYPLTIVTSIDRSR